MKEIIRNIQKLRDKHVPIKSNNIDEFIADLKYYGSKSAQVKATIENRCEGRATGVGFPGAGMQQIRVHDGYYLVTQYSSETGTGRRLFLKEYNGSFDLYVAKEELKEESISKTQQRIEKLQERYPALSITFGTKGEIFESEPK